jgi:type IV pilus assembly protein PilO
MNSINLNELSFDNVGQWPKPIKYSLVIFLSVMINALGYWLIVKSSFDDYSNLQAQEITLKKDFELKQHQASNLQAYRMQMREMKDRFGAMLKQLPTQNEMPGLLEDISKTGIASGLSFQLFAPMPEVLHDFYIEVPIKIIVVGNYHQFAVFLSRIAEMSRIVTLHDFVISRNESAANKQTKLTEEQLANAGELLTMEITAKIYRYRT